MRFRRVSVFSALVILLLLICVFHPAVLVLNPYHSNEPRYEVAHNSTDAFDQTNQDYIDWASPTSVSELSGDAQRLFLEVKEQPVGSTGWQSYNMKHCRPFVYYCDQYSERPEFPSDGHGDYITYSLLEENGELYILATSYQHGGLDFTFMLETVLKGITLIPYALILGWIAVASNASPKQEVAFAGAGLAVIIAAFAFPYIQMAFGVFQSIWPLLIWIGLAWVVIFHMIRAGVTGTPRTDS